MKANVGGIDRVIRIVLGAALIAWAVIGGGPWWVGLIGLVSLATGVVRFCGLYRLFGMSTCAAPAGKS
jgi:hypothetical protein